MSADFNVDDFIKEMEMKFKDFEDIERNMRVVVDLINKNPIRGFLVMRMVEVFAWMESMVGGKVSKEDMSESIDCFKKIVEDMYGE